MARETELFSSPKSRTFACVLGSLVAALVVTAGMPVYLPFSQTDNIGLPILLFPVTWLLLFLYGAMCQRVWRAWFLFAVLAVGHATLIFLNLG